MADHLNHKIVKMSFATNWKTGKYLFFLFVGLALFCLVFMRYKTGEVDFANLRDFPAIFLLFFAPTLYLHIEYTFLSLGKIYELSSDGVRTKDVGFVACEAIDYIEIMYSKSHANNSWIDSLGLRYYYYAVIHLKNKETIGPLTCLQSKRLEIDLGVLVLAGIPIRPEKVLIPSIPGAFWVPRTH